MKKYLLFIILTLIPLTLCAWGVGMSGVSLLSGSCTGNLGNTSELNTDVNSGEGNYCIVKQITSNCTGAGTIHVRATYTNDTDRNGTFVLFADNGSDVPSTLIESHAFTQDGVSDAHWISQAFTTSITSGTKYWIGIVLQSATSAVVFSSSTGGVGYNCTFSNYASPGNWNTGTGSASTDDDLEIYWSY